VPLTGEGDGKMMIAMCGYNLLLQN